MANKHKKQWDFLQKKFEANQLAHAYLFVGSENLGKKEFAKEFVASIGCKFPDLMIVGEQNKRDPIFGDGGEIKISQVREIQKFLSYKPYYGVLKAVIVEGAEKMNQEAQSCFLKTLEEPKGNTLVILVSSKPDMLLPTINSRCQTIKFLGKPVLSRQQIEEEGKILSGLLKVIPQDLSEKFKYAKEFDFEKQSLPLTLEVLQKYFRHLLLSRSGLPAKDSDFPPPIGYLNSCSVIKLKEDIKLIEEIRNRIIFTNASPKLALEILLISI